MILKNFLRFALLLILLPVLSQSSSAQARIGTVQGTIKDPTGALVPNAKVTISQPVTGYNQSTQTDQQGSFKLVNVPFNTYKVRAEAPDFEPVEESIDLESNIPTSVDLSLSLTGATAAVTVTADNSAMLAFSSSSMIRLIIDHPVCGSSPFLAWL